MRRYDDPLMAEERVIRRRRFDREHIERGSRKTVLFECVEQRHLIDHSHAYR
jgi:hypothetical protein